jgi:hypothetical protein
MYGQEDKATQCCCGCKEEGSAPTCSQAEEDKPGTQEEMTEFDAMNEILVQSIKETNTTTIFNNLGLTISIADLHKKYPDLEEARLLVFGLAQKAKGWRPPYFRYRRQVIFALRAAVQSYRANIMCRYLTEILEEEADGQEE